MKTEEGTWIRISGKDEVKLGDLIRFQYPKWGTIQGSVVKETNKDLHITISIELIIPCPGGNPIHAKVGENFCFDPEGSERFVPEIPNSVPRPKFLALDRGDSSRVIVELRCYQELDHEARVARSQGRPLDAFVLECERDNYSQRRR